MRVNPHNCTKSMSANIWYGTFRIERDYYQFPLADWEQSSCVWWSQ